MEDAYEVAAQTIQEVLQNGRSLKSVVFNGPSINKKKVYAIAIETLKRKTALQAVLERAGLSGDADAYYFWMVLAYEHAFGNARSVSEYAREQNVERELRQITDASSQLPKVENAAESNSGGQVTLPKYVRVNTLKASMEAVLKELQESGYEEYLVGVGAPSFRKWRKTVQKLSKESFMRDFDFPDQVLVFAHNADLHTLPVYTGARVIITDKSSMLPALALAPPRNAHVLDACAAPGNKTAVLGSLLQNSGKLFAFDRDAARFRTLQRRLQQLGVRNVVCANVDFLAVSPDAQLQQFDARSLASVQYLLVDPSCSGSGMVSRFANDAEFASGSSHVSGAFATQKDPERLRKLSNFQSMLLRHALTAFPNAKRVVYSTCSLFEEENEAVVRDVLSHEQVRGHFRLVLPAFAERLGGVKSHHASDGEQVEETDDVALQPQVTQPVPEPEPEAESQPARKKRKKNKNKSEQAEPAALEQITIEEIQKNTLRIDPRRALTNGFFVACFERVS